jgi:hypothetical protein
MSATRAESRQCALDAAGVDVSTPAEIDALLAADEAASPAALEAFESCEPVWRAGYRAAEAQVVRSFTERHADELAGAAQYYAAAIDVMRSDADFMRYVGESAARLSR